MINISKIKNKSKNKYTMPQMVSSASKKSKQAKGIGKDGMGERSKVMILYTRLRGDLSDKLVFKKRPERSKGLRPVDI